MAAPEEISQLLAAHRRDEPGAMDQLFPRAYPYRVLSDTGAE